VISADQEGGSVATQAYDDRPSGWLEFVAILMFAVAFFRIIQAIEYFMDKHRVNDLTGGLFEGSSWAWGLWDLAIAAVAILAGLSLLAGGGFGRVLGYIFGVMIVVQGFTVLGLAPWYGALSIAVGTLVIYGIASNPRGAA
jgi:hypothetical protein